MYVYICVYMIYVYIYIYTCIYIYIYIHVYIYIYIYIYTHVYTSIGGAGAPDSDACWPPLRGHSLFNIHIYSIFVSVELTILSRY